MNASWNDKGSVKCSDKIPGDQIVLGGLQLVYALFLISLFLIFLWDYVYTIGNWFIGFLNDILLLFVLHRICWRRWVVLSSHGNQSSWSPWQQWLALWFMTSTPMPASRVHIQRISCRNLAWWQLACRHGRKYHFTWEWHGCKFELLGRVGNWRSKKFYIFLQHPHQLMFTALAPSRVVYAGLFPAKHHSYTARFTTLSCGHNSSIDDVVES